ncbi:hypothetical protein Syun_015145 [Stephania yunnanensis]|uniref:Uncharacterized protein n=1 Tax=Stephania yunnanensis TaxID=152371 RepID=A0AAP0JLH9_9MAGN
MSILWSLFNQDDVDKHGADAEIGNAKVLRVSSSTKDDDIRVSNNGLFTSPSFDEQGQGQKERRKKSLERSNSMRKKSYARIVVEIEEGRKVVVGNIAKEEDYSGSLELVAFKDSVSFCGGIGIGRKGSKKSQLK